MKRASSPNGPQAGLGPTAHYADSPNQPEYQQSTSPPSTQRARSPLALGA